MSKKSNLKPILITDLILFIMLILVYYFGSNYTLLNSIVLSFLCTLFVFALTVFGRRFFEKKS